MFVDFLEARPNKPKNKKVKNSECELNKVYQTDGQHEIVGPNLFVERMERCKHYEKKGCFATSFTTQFLSYIKHLQLIVVIHCEYYKASYKSCNSPYI
jgi:hypothetical protein